MPQLLLELFSEDVPARMQRGAARDLDRLAREHLGRAEMAFDSIRAFAGLRRLTLVVEGLASVQADKTEERKGPRVGAPQAAIEGFLRSAGLARDDLIERDGVYFATLARQGRPTAEIIAEMVPAVVRGFPWPKSMTWESGTLRWVRPLRRILCVFDRRIVAFDIEGLAAGDLSEGHRFMGTGNPFRARDFDEYREALAGHFVVLDVEERERRIGEGARALCAAHGLDLIEDEGLLTEVAGMVEWPVPLLGSMDPAFLDLPAEVIATTMRTHQRYFTVRGGEGALAPRFVAVANIEASDGGAAIAAGNARVLSARLDDARFFWNEDRKVPLESRLETLKGVTFHAKLGAMYERALRIEALAREIAPMVGAPPQMAARAGRLAKADLASAMVGEFPELQGVMGGYYARAEGLDASIADAIADHYKPRGPGDGLPAGPISIAVALADKLDTLVGFFEIGEKPTGSRDPFALRRTALGVIRIALTQSAGLNLRPLIAYAGAGVAVSVIRHVADSRLNALNYRQAVAAFADPAAEFAAADWLEATFRALAEQGPAKALDFWRGLDDAAWIEEILAFVLERLRILLRDEGLRHDVCDAVFALGDDDLVRLVARARALEAFLATDNGANLLAGGKRAINILAAEAKKGSLPAGEPTRSPDLPKEEVALIDALSMASPRVDTALAADDFAAALGALADLRAPVDAFFDQVLVNSPIPEERDNRLRLLSRVGAAMGEVADFSLISG
ncbi:MAG: glycine--tRNA ligase subunit beta [Caulobacteraceae bacterium]